MQATMPGRGKMCKCAHTGSPPALPISPSLWNTHSDSLVVEPTGKQGSSSHIHRPGTEMAGLLGGLRQPGRRYHKGPELLETAAAYISYPWTDTSSKSKHGWVKHFIQCRYVLATESLSSLLLLWQKQPIRHSSQEFCLVLKASKHFFSQFIILKKSLIALNIVTCIGQLWKGIWRTAGNESFDSNINTS